VASDDIYVQITASQGEKSRSVVVLVPESARRSSGETGKSKPEEQNAAAQRLAEPFARYAFTHRTIFHHHEVAYAFYQTEPEEIKGRAPQLTQNGLRAWII
jgi:hypothetical protein